MTVRDLIRVGLLAIALTAMSDVSPRAFTGAESAPPAAEESGGRAQAIATASPVDQIRLTALTNRDLDSSILVLVVTGIAAALVVVFGLQYVDDALVTAEDVVTRLGVPCLGRIPAMEDRAQPMTSRRPPGELADAYRAVGHAVAATMATSPRILALTGVQEREGTTTTACNLATTIASTGARVLLIDANLRRPRLDVVMQLPARTGLFHVLVGQARIRDAVQRTADANLYVMTAGRTAQNADEVLNSERMKHLLRMLRRGPFDWVILDVPSVMKSEDALTLSPLVDGVALVLAAERTRVGFAERAVQVLKTGSGPVVGAVLNRVSAAPRGRSIASWFRRAS